MKPLLLFLRITVFCAFSSASFGTPTVQFKSAAVTVSQTAGVVEIPFAVAGSLYVDPYNGADKHTVFEAGNQDVTAKADVDYGAFKSDHWNGRHDVWVQNYNGISSNGTISIPIYFTRSPTSKSFNVLLYPCSQLWTSTTNAQVVSPSAVTVTILGYVEPKVQITTSTSKPGVVRIEGRVKGVATRDIRKISATISGKKLTVYGKTTWYSKRTIKKTGKYFIKVRVHLKNGDSLYTERTLKVAK